MAVLDIAFLRVCQVTTDSSAYHNNDTDEIQAMACGPASTLLMMTNACVRLPLDNTRINSRNAIETPKPAGKGQPRGPGYCCSPLSAELRFLMHTVRDVCLRLPARDSVNSWSTVSLYNRAAHHRVRSGALPPPSVSAAGCCGIYSSRLRGDEEPSSFPLPLSLSLYLYSFSIHRFLRFQSDRHTVAMTFLHNVQYSDLIPFLCCFYYLLQMLFTIMLFHHHVIQPGFKECVWVCVCMSAAEALVLSS